MQEGVDFKEKLASTLYDVCYQGNDKTVLLENQIKEVVGKESRKKQTQQSHEKSGVGNEVEFNTMMDDMKNEKDKGRVDEDTCIFLPFVIFFAELIEMRKSKNVYMISEGEFGEAKVRDMGRHL